MKLPNSSRRSALSKGMAFAMSYLLLWGSVPAPALAEAVEELGGNGQPQAELVVQDDESEDLVVDGQPDLSNEEESAVAKLANQVREGLAEDASQEELLSVAFHALADVVTVDDELTLEEGEAIDAALAGEATTTQGITDAFVALVEELGFTAELAHEEDGVPLAHVQLGDEWIGVNIALAARDRVENGLDAAEDPWASKDETQDQEEATASQNEQTDEAAQPVEEERQSQEESDSVENQKTEVESTDADGTENESAEAEEEEEEEVEYIYEEIDASNLTTFAATNVPLTAQADSSVAQTTSNVTTYAPYEYDSVRYSYLYVNEKGSLVRVEYSESEQTLYVQELDSSLLVPVTPKVIDQKTYMPSTGSASTLQWGGFYKGASGFFVVTGLSNSAKNENTIVYRITKYDKNWTQKGAAEFMDNLDAVPESLRDGVSNGAIHYGTVVPFSESGVSMDEVGTTLHVRTAHQNFAGHQTNVHLVVNETSMSITGSMTYTANQGGTEYGYVSHSFAQRLAQYNGSLYALDLGDASPRALTVKRIGTTGDSSYSNVLVIGGAKGVNYTGVTVGGFEASSAGLMSAYASIDQNAFTGKGDFSPRNVYVAVTPANPNPGTSTITKLTSYPDSGTTGGDLVKLVKINDNRFLVIWAEMKTDGDASWTDINQRGDVCYTFVNGNGVPETIYRGHGYLSDCDPVLENGRVVWYAEDVYGNHTPVYYQIDLTTNKLSSPQVKGNMQDIDDVEIPDQEYTGAAITPTFDVVLNGKTLTEGDAYELVYANNTNVSTDSAQASVTVRGIADNGYTSTKTFTFNIIKATPRVVPANTSLALIVGGSSGKVTAKVYTSDTSTNTAAKSYGSVTYTSSNTAVATVTTGGVVKPVKEGECNITIETTGNSNWNPAEPVVVPVEVRKTKGNPTIEASNITLKMGETAEVEFTVTAGAGAITYSSADKYTVAVGTTSGVLTPKKVGSVEITIKCAESEAYAAATKTITVTVEPGTPTITVPEHKTLVVGGSTVSLGATFSPSSGIGAKTYTSSNPDVVAVSSSGVLTAKGAGTATVTTSVAESTNYKAAQAITTVTVAKGTPTITAADKSLEVGDEVKIGATTTPTTLKGDLTFASSNEKVATVSSDGVISAVGAGEATITVALPETANYGEASKEISVEVAKGTPQIVAYTTSVAMGDTGVVDAYFSAGEGPLTYAVDDPTVAEVDTEGNVVPKNVGTTPVTISFAGDANWEPATATTTIKVTQGTPYITAMEASVGMGGTSHVVAKLTPDVGPLTYTSKNTGVVTVDANTGVLTPVKVGYTTINVSFAGNANWKAASEPVSVMVSSGTATVTASNLTMKYGEEPKQITASVQEAEAGSLLYMIDDESIATVDENGRVTAVKPGTTTATVMSMATDEYASGIAEITITVEQGTPTLAAEPVTVAMGTTGQINASGPEGVNSFSYKSSNESIVKVNEAGELTPMGVGNATITVTSAATVDWKQGSTTANVTVTKGEPTIEASNITIPVGDKDESIQATTNGGTLSFQSLNTAVVEVDASTGKLTPKATGTAQVEITSAANTNWNAGSTTITVTVEEGNPTITAKDVTVAMGKTAEIDATVTKGAGALSYQSANTNVVTVDGSGKLAPVHVGTAKITISCAKNAHWNSATKDITVTVEKGMPTITASNVSVEMGGEETKITATASEGAGALSFTSQKESIAKVDSTGTITPVGVGTANVLVASAETDDWAEGTTIVKVDVTKGTPSITVANTSVGIGKTASLGAKLNDGAVSGSLTYTSRNESVVTVSTSGVLTPVAVGQAQVEIAFKGNTNWNAVTKEVTVTVTPGAATIAADDISLAMGTTKTISATVEGGGKLSFESKNTAVVTVDSSGKLTPVKVGTAKVDITSEASATHGAGSKTITVTVTKGTPTVTANDITLTMGGSTATITPKAYPEGATSFTYTSANTSVATVTSAGVVTAKSGGTTTITVKSAANTNWNASTPTTVTVTVNPGTPTITATNKSTSMGKTVSLGATTNGGTLSYKSSKESVATVSASGVVTPKAAGTAIITITSAATTSWMSVSKTVTVTVLKATPTISMSNKSVQMGKTVSMGATVSKGGGGVTYESADEDIAIVNERTGVVTPVSAGTVKITAVSSPTAGYQSARKEATVTVTEGTPVITAVNLNFAYGTKGKIVGAKVSSGAKLTYTSSKPAVVTVDPNTGALTAQKAGTSYITIAAAPVSKKWKAVSRRIRVKIVKAAQPISAKTKNISVSYSKAKQTVDTPAVTATAPGNRIKYTRSAGSSKIKIDKKTGKITVAKKTKKGKYTITAKITASATSQYKKATKKVTFTVTVK